MIFAYTNWTDPSTSAPGGNIAPPINISPNNQTKSGNLSIGTGLSYWITKSGDSFALNNNAGTTKFVIGQDGNVGIGTAEPVAIWNGYTTLDIRGSGGGGFRFGKSGGDHGILYSDGDTVYLESSDGSNDPLTLNPWGGNVGIGTTTPNYPLSVGGGLGNTKIALWDGAAGGAAFGLGVQGSQFRLHLNAAGDRFSFLNGAAGTEIVTFLGTGSVGIGTTAPSAKLEVQTGGGNAASLILHNNYTGNGSVAYKGYFSTSNGGCNYGDGIHIGFFDTGSAGPSCVTMPGHVMSILKSGNVGIGITNPGAKLEVAGQVKITGGSPAAGRVLTSDASGLASWTTLTGTLPSGTSGQTLRHDGTNWVANGTLYNDGTAVHIGTGLNYWITKSGDSFALNNNAGATKFVIGQDGNVGIGTTGPGYTLDVNGIIRAGASALLSTGGPAGYYQDSTNGAYRSIVSSSTTNGYYFQTNAGSTTTMYVGLGGTYNGNVGIGTAAPSDKLHIFTSSGAAKLRTEANNGAGSVRSYTFGTGTSDYNLHIKDETGGSDIITALYNNGNVGIGTTSPGAKLEVAGQVKITGGTPGAGKVLTSDASGLATWTALTGTLPAGTSGQTLRHDGTNWVANSVLYNDGTAVHIGTGLNYWITKSGDSFALNNNAGATKFVVGQDGNVGIGTTAPGQKLEVAGSTYITTGMLMLPGSSSGGWGGQIGFSNSESQEWMSFPNVNQELSFTAINHGAKFNWSSADNTLVLKDNGSVGIGTTSPNGKLQVAGSFSNFDVGAQDGNDRPSIGITGNYPQLVLMSGVANVNHGPTVSLAAYDSGSSGTFKSWTLGTAGNNATFLDIGYGTSGNPHINGIRGYGTTVMTLLNSGYVGVGTTAPGAKLEVAGQVKITGGTPGAGKVLTSDASGLATWTALTGTLPAGTSGQTLRHDGTNWVANSALYNDGTAVHIGTGLNYWITKSGDSFALNNNAGATKFVIGQDGNVGIGTTSPGYKLDVAGDIRATGTIYANANGAKYFQGGDDAALYDLNTLNTMGVYGVQDSTVGSIKLGSAGGTISGYNGNVGVGTASPQTALEIRSGNTPALTLSGTGGRRLQIYGLSDDGNAHMGLGVDMSGGPYEHSIYYPAVSGGKLTIGTYSGTTYSEKVRVDNSGNVGVGTTAPGAKLEVAGDIMSQRWIPKYSNWAVLGDGGAGIVNSNEAAYKALMIVGSDQGTGSGRVVKVWDTLDVQGTLKVNGIPLVGGGQWAASGSNIYNSNSGNVGIGTTSPSQKLHVLGTDVGGTEPPQEAQRPTVEIEGTYPNLIIKSAGNASHSSTIGLWAYDGTNTQQWNMGVGQNGLFSMGYTTNQTNPHAGINNYAAASVLSMNTSGNVGIGTTSPGYTLDVNGSIHSSGSATIDGNFVASGKLNAVNNGANANYITFGTNGGDYYNWYVNSQTNGSGVGTRTLQLWYYPYDSVPGCCNQILTFNGAGTMQWSSSNQWNFNGGATFPGSGIWNTSGNVGIGTTSPGGRLHVSNSTSQYLVYGSSGNLSAINAESVGASVETRLGSAYNRAGLYVGNSDLNLLSSGGIALGAGGNTTHVFINTSGNVGIGTASPGAKLEVAGQVKITGGSPAAGRVLTSDASGLATWQTPASGGITGSGTTNYVPKFTGASALGNSVISESSYGIGIGRTATSAKLEVGGDLGVFGVFGATGMSHLAGGASVGGNATVSGSVTAAAFYYNSDAALKENIVPISDGLDKIDELTGTYFNWKDSGSPSMGLIAQDVEKVFPQAVSTNPETGLKTVDYGKLVAPLIEAVKTQQGQIDALKASAIESNNNAKSQQTKIETLEAEVEKLKSQDNEAD